ncbi:MAG TPA: CAP domain-containing protein [Solirubrobacter sp.]|nr:CAP domain-containing protein [Solirubrobacter sp.]
MPAAHKLLTVSAICAGLLVAAPAADAKKKSNEVVARIALGDKRKPTKAKPRHKRHKHRKHHKRHAVEARAALAPCQNTTVLPTADNLDAVNDAILCLHNQIRAQNDLPLLRENSRLRKAAISNSNTMVGEGYFGHTSPEGDTFVDRILGARYAKRNGGWTLGENLAWGTGELSTPGAIMQEWMASSGHRANILKRSYREIGIGIRLGVPSDDTVGATVTADFGVKL